LIYLLIHLLTDSYTIHWLIDHLMMSVNSFRELIRRERSI